MHVNDISQMALPVIVMYMYVYDNFSFKNLVELWVNPGLPYNALFSLRFYLTDVFYVCYCPLKNKTFVVTAEAGKPTFVSVFL